VAVGVGSFVLLCVCIMVLLLCAGVFA
jgi:hypothetical protein